MKKNPRYTLKHLSVRVPWHDNAWNGTVCKSPADNGACLILKSCALKRNDEHEATIAGKKMSELDEEQFPPCVGERATFMADFSYHKTLRHPYAVSSPGTHGHLQPTKVRFPAYTAAAVPYQWMLKENAEVINQQFDLGFNPAMEPLLDWNKDGHKVDTWMQEAGNQKAFLNCFFEHFEAEASLVFFYAKQVPFVEERGRVLVGVGRIKKLDESTVYEGSNKKFSAAYWEHMVHHSIRPDFKDGFLLPYHEALEYSKQHPEFNPAELAVITPPDKQPEFSYGAEHVSTDSCIRVLLMCVTSIEKAKQKGIGKKHDQVLSWIHNRIHELEKLRGDYPGMGAALCALGFDKGQFIASEIINSVKENENPWRRFDEVVNDPPKLLSPQTAKEITGMAVKTYLRYQKREDKTRLHFLYLLSRFDITRDQATILFSQDKRKEYGISFSDKDFLDNPYLLYEATRRTDIPIDLTTIDLGVYTPVKSADDVLQITINDAIDERRLRALAIYELEAAAVAGHTLLPRKEIINRIHARELHPACKPEGDHYEVAEDIFNGEIMVTEMKNEEPAYQLKLFYSCGEKIREKITGAMQGERHSVDADWLGLLNEELEQFTEGEPDEQELLARKEKAAALKEIAEARFSVLIGPAGTGKTTLLKILAGHRDVRGSVLFLAPTGKARVRIEELTSGLGVEAKTVAQFLNQYNRFDGYLQQYKFSNEFCDGIYETVILDEASMLTEEMLATLLHCFKGLKRFILVGDHRQLPPIGAGRPFVDVINHIKSADIDSRFPKVSASYAELTIRRRQGGSRREDLQLAEWFSGNTLEPGADQIINDILQGKESKYLRLVSWKSEEDFQRKFEQVIVDELDLKSIDNVEAFNKSLGSHDGKYFNSSLDAEYFELDPSVEKIEDWQILSPLREKQFGVRSINRRIHTLFRKERISYAYKSSAVIPKPVGSEEIVYGDKVINLYNQRRDFVYPNDGLNYIANGEIGLVTGQFKRKNAKFAGQPINVEVEFASQKGYVYSFRSRDFSDEGDPALELAYTITVHKSQGSEFKKVFLVVPDPCFLLTREMLYTALTRQKDKVIVLYQGDAFKVKELSQPIHSDTLGRYTNLFAAPEMVEHKGKFLERNLIHQASDGTLLRSKSELIIYQQLLNKGLTALYEQPLVINEVEKLPDFTIKDEYSNRVFYWEHCGMMHDKEYRERWEEKLKWYRKNQILPIEEKGGKNGTLIVTYDTPVVIDGQTKGAFSIMQVDEYIGMIRRK